MADSYGLGAQHPAPAEVGADAEPAIYDPVVEHTDAERDEALKAVERTAAEQATKRYERRRTTAPWQRTGPREIVFRDDWLHISPVFLGPFGPGDHVTVNDTITGVIEFATSKGFLVMPEQGPGKCHLGHWVIGANVVSIRPVGWIEEGTAPRPPADERVVHDSVDGDVSLPMSPPPMQPGGEATFR